MTRRPGPYYRENRICVSFRADSCITVSRVVPGSVPSSFRVLSQFSLTVILNGSYLFSPILGKLRKMVSHLLTEK